MKNTEEQAKIIRTKKSIVEVQAYAGCAKTTTLKRRIRHLLDSGIKSGQILALSFSKSTADDLGKGMDGNINIQTFHAFSLSLVRKYYKNLSFKKQPKKLLEGASKIKLLKDAVEESKKSAKTIRDTNGIDLKEGSELNRLIRFFDRVQGNRALAQSLINETGGEFYCYNGVLKNVEKIYKRFNKLKQKAGVIDYPDMLSHGIKLSSVAAVDWDYQYLFIDESQDMTLSQSLMLKELATCIPNLMIFGDPYQSIYGFAGGAYRDLSELLDRKVTEFGLTKSFRLTQTSADLVNALFKQMDINAPALQGRPSRIKPELIKTDEQEAVVVDRVQKIIAKEPLASIAILARTKAQLRYLETHLLCEGINLKPLKAKRGEEVDAVLELVELLDRYEAISKQKKIEAGSIEKKILRVAGINGKKLTEDVIAKCRRMFVKAAKTPSLSGRYTQMVRLHLKLLRAAKVFDHEKLNHVRNILGQWEPYISGKKSVAEIRQGIANISEAPGIVTGTIHAAKGLEFDYVFVLNVVQGCIPFYKQVEKGEVEEELRLLYVACSRAKKKTILLQAPYFASSGKKYYRRSEYMKKSVMKMLTCST